MMRRNLYLVLAFTLAVNTFAAAQAGSVTDLRADEQRLRQEESQLDRDRDRLTFDRRHHAPRGQIRADEAQIRRDRVVIKRLRADIKRDRRIRRSYRRGYLIWQGRSRKKATRAIPHLWHFLWGGNAGKIF